MTSAAASGRSGSTIIARWPRPTFGPITFGLGAFSGRLEEKNGTFPDVSAVGVI